MNKTSTARDLSMLFIRQIVEGNATTQKGVGVLKEVLDRTSGDEVAASIIGRLETLEYKGRHEDVERLVNRFGELYASGKRR